MNNRLPARVSPSPPSEPYAQSIVPGDYLPLASPNPKRFPLFVLRYWWLPVLAVSIAAGAAAAYIHFAPPVFVSSSRMWETEKIRLPEGGGFTQDLQNYLGTQIELLRSEKIAQLTLDRLRSSDSNSIPMDEQGKPLKVRLRVNQTPKTAMIELDAFSPSPSFGQAYLNSLMQSYLEYKQDVRKNVSGDTLSSISEQALRVERDLKADQEALTTFERTNNLAILDEEGRIAGGYLARLKTQLSDLQLESKLLEAIALEQDSHALGSTNGSGFLIATSLPGSPESSSTGPGAERQTAFRELALLKIQREKLSRYLRPKHPKIVKLDADIERGQKLLDLYRSQSQEELSASRKALEMRLESVQKSISEWETKVVDANSRIAEAERLKLNVNRTQSLYDRLALLLQNVDLTRNTDRETLAILESATPALRSHRRDMMVLVLALLTGASVALGIIFLLELRDDRFTSMLEVNEQFGDSIVGQVPELRGLKNSGPLLQLDDPRHMYAESYRSLRSALLFLSTEGEHPKTLLITSALPNEGKSTIAANLAKVLALGGARVLLVDGDMRKGSLHELLGFKREPGLSDLLQKPIDFAKVIQTDSTPNLAFISRGKTPRNPGDLFLRQELDQLLTQWRERFDYVLIDSCPVFAADDAATLAHKIDGTLFVVRRGFSRGTVVREALEMLVQRKARVLGLVFNRADSSSRSYNYYKHAEYYGASTDA
jgi:succinoglycan biosynthesis transport protein ExoP